MLFVAFGATVLVPILIGIDPAVALFTAGLSTLIFHWITKWRVPIFSGSSFVFIAPAILGMALYGYAGVLSGFIAVAFVFFIIALLIKIKGIDFINKLFPPVVIGPVIMIIGLSLATTAISMSSKNWLLAGITLVCAILIVIFGKKTIKLIPIIGSILIAYVFAMIFGMVDFSPIANASWFSIPKFMFPKFNWGAILLMIPIAIAPIIEHIGDVYAISKAVGKNFIKNPGLSRTLFADGFTTMISAFFGGPPTTTYSEVTGAIILTKLKDPLIIRIAAITAICFAFIGKITGFLYSIPEAILGGTMILLFGMISIVGIKTLFSGKVNLDSTKSMVIISVMLVIGIGNAIISSGNFTLAGVSLASIVGIVLNFALPSKE